MFKLIALPYALDALEPVISANTLSFHHGKHLQAYVDNLNKILAGTEWEDKPLEQIVRTSTGAIFNNAGQILNHNLYFSQFTPSGSELKGKIKAQIEQQWGSVDVFKSEFEQKGTSLFGSGWVWLQANASGELSIAQYAGADNPVAHNLKPLLTFDVWEHAYYLDYQNRRPAYLHSLWPIVNWSEIEKRYSK
ncbi:MAG: superoxide dismutase [Bacteroidales bacterium]|jgi:Fe-Mn family superoxide dismutase|nr:superoxide dismutase [Bacteroidales bacterium]